MFNTFSIACDLNHIISPFQRREKSQTPSIWDRIGGIALLILMTPLTLGVLTGLYLYWANKKVTWIKNQDVNPSDQKTINVFNNQEGIATSDSDEEIETDSVDESSSYDEEIEIEQQKPQPVLKNVSNNLPESFDIQEFKKNVRQNVVGSSVEPQVSPIENIVLSDYHKQVLGSRHIRNGWYWWNKNKTFVEYCLIVKGLKERKLEVWPMNSQWLVLAFSDLPGVVFKMDQVSGGVYGPDQGPTNFSVDQIGKKMYGVEVAPQICKDHNLHYLYVPKAKWIDVGDGKQVIVEERFDCPYSKWYEQEQIYEFIQKDVELRDYAEVLLKQLILFTIVSGFGNTKYDKIPILPNGMVAMHDLKLGPYLQDRNSGFQYKAHTFGLWGSGCYEEEGIFSHIIPERRKALKKYALEVANKYCPERLQILKKKLEHFWEKN